MGFDVVVVVVGIWLAEGCQHEHWSCVGCCSDVDVDGIMTAASH